MSWGILPACVHLPPDPQGPLLNQTPWLAAGQSRRARRVVNPFGLIRQKWVPLRTPRSPGPWARSQSRAPVTPPEHFLWFFTSFQGPGHDTSDSADVADAPPDHSWLGNAVSMQGRGPSHPQFATAESRGLPGKITRLPRNQSDPSKLRVCRLLLRTSPTPLLRTRISPFR